MTHPAENDLRYVLDDGRPCRCADCPGDGECASCGYVIPPASTAQPTEENPK